MNFLFLGDTHGNIWQIEYAFDRAEEAGCSYIIQLGDFGYWEHRQEGQAFLDAVSHLTEEYEIPFYFIDGNHENFDWLYEYPIEDGFRRIRNGLYHIPRSATWEWDGVKFLALGGSHSIDKRYRVPGKSWWPQEMPTDVEVAEAKKVGKVDVMLTHDVPEGADLSGLLGADWKAKSESPVECAEARRKVREVFDTAKPYWLFHGHYHRRFSSMLEGVGIEGLSNEGTGKESYTVRNSVELTKGAPQRIVF